MLVLIHVNRMYQLNGYSEFLILKIEISTHNTKSTLEIYVNTLRESITACGFCLETIRKRRGKKRNWMIDRSLTHLCVSLVVLVGENPKDQPHKAPISSHKKTKNHTLMWRFPLNLMSTDQKRFVIRFSHEQNEAYFICSFLSFLFVF